MTTKMYDRLRADHGNLRRELKSLVDKAQGEGREFTSDEQEQVGSLTAQLDGVKNRMDQINADEKLSKALGDIGFGGGDGPRFNDGGPSEYVPTGAGSKWARQVAGKLITQADRHGVKALTTGSIDVPAVVEQVVQLPARPTRVLDLIPRRTLTEHTYQYLRQTVRTSNAAPVADGGTKPTSIYTVGEVEERSRVFAHLSQPFPNRYFADFVELIRLLDTQMREDLMLAVETSAISGDGTGENFTGILNVSGTLAQAWNTNLLTTTRKAMTLAEVNFQTPSAWVMNPTDWELIDQLADNDNRYFFGGPAAMATKMLHGLPVVTSTAVTAGGAILGDWSQARLRVREDMRLDSDSSGTNFTTNQTVLRVEGRFAFDVTRPAAFVEVDLAA